MSPDPRIDAAKACARERDNWIGDGDVEAILAAADAVSEDKAATLAAHLHGILANRDAACIAGKWYTIVPTTDARFERAVLALAEFGAVPSKSVSEPSDGSTGD